MTQVVGIVNVTDDSFSDGGQYLATEAAIAHGKQLTAQGASWVDVGGESTRPGAARVPVEVEMERVIPVVAGLTAAGVRVSVDTMRAVTAQAAVEVGACMVNDVSGGGADPEMLPCVARLGVEYVCMHWRAHSLLMAERTNYEKLVDDVIAELLMKVDLAVAAGVDPAQIILDPGIGFSKTAEQNWTLVRSIARFQELGHRLLVGVSRKSFLGEALDGVSPADRDGATAILTAWCAANEVWAVRTHEVPSQLDAIRVAERLLAAGPLTN